MMVRISGDALLLGAAYLLLLSAGGWIVGWYGFGNVLWGGAVTQFMLWLLWRDKE